MIVDLCIPVCDPLPNIALPTPALGTAWSTPVRSSKAFHGSADFNALPRREMPRKAGIVCGFSPDGCCGGNPAPSYRMTRSPEWEKPELSPTMLRHHLPVLQKSTSALKDKYPSEFISWVHHKEPPQTGWFTTGTFSHSFRR